ncbi:MAG: MBG domain-containing protein, partial [Verrucomicrobiota bacterium]
TLNIGGDLVISGGTFNLALDQQTVGGTTYTASGNRTLNLAGSYNQTGGAFKCDYLQSRGGSRAVHFQGPGNSFTQSAGTLATANLDFFVDNGAALTLNNNLSVSKSFTNSSGGTLNCGPNVISGAATFTLSSGATLGIGSTAGISSSGSSGNIQTTTRNYNSAANYAYNGSAPQVTGAGLPPAITGLTVNNGAGVTLSATTTVNGTLTLASGQLLTSAYQINLAATGSVAGGGTGSYINGLTQKAFGTAGNPQTFTFPIGDAANYTPINLAAFTVGTTGTLTASTTPGDHPSVSSSGLDANRTVNRYWTLTAGGGLVASGNVTFNYPATDVDNTASPAQFMVRRFSTGTWSTTTGSGTPTATATTVAGQGAFGDFAIGNQLIDHYVVSAPASQGTGLGFTVAVAAQDALNQPVVGDNSTVVTMASSGSVQFDGNGDGTFGDNAKSLSAGALTITAKDPAAESVTVSVTDANGKAGVSSPILIYDGGKGSQTISFPALGNKNYGDAPFAVSASASSGLPVSFSIVSGPASVNGNLITISGAGLVTVRASQAGDQNWNSAPDVQQSFNVAKAPLSVTADNQSRPYGSANPALTGTIAGIQNGDAISASYTTTATAASPAGTYDIVPTVSGPLANYNITTNKGILTVAPVPLTVRADDKSRPYRAANPPLTFTCIGFVNSETVAVLAGSPSLSTTADTNSPAGSYPIVASQGTLSDPNYSFIFANGTLTVTPTNAILLSDDFERPTYPGDMTPWVALQGAWLATNANFQGTSSATNYSFAYLAANWTNYSLQAQIQFSASNAYGGGLAGRLDPATGARYAAWIYPEQSPAGPALLRLIKFRDWTTWSSTPMALVSLPAVGTNWHTLNLAFQGYQITVSFDGVQRTNVNDYGFDSRPAYASGGISADTYTFGASEFIMSIDNAQVTALAPVLLPLTVTANDARRAYGAANPSFTGTIVGLQPGDNISATYSTTAVANSPVGIYQIAPTLSDPDNKLGNYAVTTNFGALTVTQAVLTVNADATSKVYGNADPALTYQLTSGALVSGDNFTGGLTRATGETVGAHAIQQGTLTAGTNYTLIFVGANLTIGPKAITVTADAGSKVYGDADPALTYQLTSGALVSGDNFTGSLTRAAGENVGTHAILQGTLSAGANYTLTFVGANLTIGPKAITVTADAGSKAYGEADPAFTYQITSGSLVDGDSLTGALTRLSGENAGTYAIQRGSLAANDNYSLSFIGAEFVISPAGSVTAVSSSMNPSPQGSNVTFTASFAATLTPNTPATTTPTGNVQFYTNGVALGGPVALDGGVASISTAQLPPGTNIVTAAYAGDGNFYGSSNSLVQVVSVIAQTPSTLGLTANIDGTVTITFQGTPGAQYLVQAAIDPGQSVGWENVSTNTAGPDGQWTFTDSMAAHSQRFYRSAKP